MIGRRDIDAMKGYQTPPPRLTLVLDAVAILLGWSPQEWSNNYQRMMINVPAFLQQLTDFDIDSVSMAKVAKLKPLVCRQPDFTFAHTKCASVAVAHMCNWVLAIYCQARDSPATATIEPVHEAAP
mmetsp:Transcript_33395/g.44001  ORF Transcript_33395/g.44001 Transcript_33395/m.44001 type:complete len:126 (-) Transcript_33395:239-616(-)